MICINFFLHKFKQHVVYISVENYFTHRIPNYFLDTCTKKTSKRVKTIVIKLESSGSGTTSLAWSYMKVCGYSDIFCKNLNQRSFTPRWPLTPHLLRSYVWLYPRIIVSKSHENTSKYVDTVTFFAKTWSKGHWPLGDLWPHICWGHMCDSTQGRDCHIFAHWGRSLCSKKCAQLVFSCFWLQNWCVLKFAKSCQFFDTLSFSL